MRFTRKLKKPISFGLRIDHLWMLAVLIGFGFILSLVPQPPHDFWWHLKIGQMIRETGNIPETNLYGWTIDPATPFFYGAWLAEWLYFVIYKLGGLALVFFTRNLLALFAFGIIGLQAKLQSGSWRIAGMFTALACVMTANNLIARPQNWAWLPFALFSFFLNLYVTGKITGKWLLLLPILMMFWTNVHGSFVTGIVLLVIYLVGETLRAVIHSADALPRKKIEWLGVIAVLTIFAVIVNPQGVGIFGYVFKLMSDQPSQLLIAEWQSPTPSDIPLKVFYISILLLIPLFTYTRRKPTLTELLLCLAFLWLSWSGARYVVWYGMLVASIMAKAASGISLIDIFVIPEKWKSKLAGIIQSGGPVRARPINLLLGVIFFALLIPFQPWFIDKLPMPETYWEKVRKAASPGPMLSLQTPVEAVEYLRQHPGGHLFNDMGFGSYLIWAFPEQGVFLDPRVELYPYEQWLDYIRICNGIRYNQLLEQYGADRLLLDEKEQKELIGILDKDPVWRKEYDDEIAQLWIKVK